MATTTNVKVTLPVGVARKVKALADAEHRTLAGYIQHIVSVHVESTPTTKA